MGQHPKWVEFMREQFTPGTRVRLAELKDLNVSLPSGSKGTVESMDGQCRLHIRWDGGQSALLMPGMDRFSVIPAPLETLKLYMPLTARAYEKNRYGDWEEEPYEMDGRQLLSYEDNIVAALLKERGREETERGLMTYYGKKDAVNRKVQSYVFTAEKVGGQLMGVAERRVRENLSDAETTPPPRCTPPAQRRPSSAHCRPRPPAPLTSSAASGLRSTRPIRRTTAWCLVSTFDKRRDP